MYCKKRNEEFEVKGMPQDYCVDCKHFDILKDCWVCDLPFKMEYVEDIIVFPTEKVIQTPFFSYTVDRQDNPKRIYFKDGQELDLSNLNVIIHDDGIQFLEG